MNIATHISSLSCPVCFEALSFSENAVVCGNSHTFDLAKETYLNLLLSQHKKSKNPGDTKEMLVARRAFLEKEYYKPLSDAVNTCIKQFCDLHEDKKVIFDTGCGEGYYTNALQIFLHDKSITFLGMDIAKEAVRMAAKKYTEIVFFVGTIMKRMPVKDASVDVVLNIFSPRNPGEFARVLKKDGIAVIVIPASGHVSNIRSLLGQDAITEHKEKQVIEAFREHFTCIEQQEIVFEKDMPQQDVLSLIKMTPIFWQTAEHMLEKVSALTQLTVNMRFSLLVFKKK